jgi:precorrin-2/cobalt-factor-2 C20-methyltransferase
MTGQGRLYGIGLGPGDPELLTVKAVRLIQASPVVSYFAKAGRRGNARGIVDRWMTGHAIEVPLHYPMTTEHAFDSPVYVATLAAFYTDAVATLSAHLDAGQDVALLCEGDPLFYGSFMHLFVRLRAHYQASVVPGVTGMAGCWAAAGEPMTWGDDTLTVLPGTLPVEALTARLMTTDAAVIMKLGRNFPKVRAAVQRAGLLERAIYVERGTMADERVMPLAERGDEPAPYFSLILIPGQGRRPCQGES